MSSFAAPPRARPRKPWRRRFLKGVLLLCLTSIIVGYWTLTDPVRVRDLAESYLSQIIGGRVEVGKASLSLFEGLRLEDVRVYVDDRDLPDSRIFSAGTFVLKADPRALLSGRLEATQIVALSPRVNLCEDLDGGEWNYKRLKPRQRSQSARSDRRKSPLRLPQLLLRGGVVEYSRRSGGEYHSVGQMAIDGLLSPAPGASISTEERGGRYLFDIESRALGHPVGPRVRGELDTDGPRVQATLENLQFDPAIRLMLPSQVQRWWDAHQLSGRIRVPRFQYRAGEKRSDAEFLVELEFEEVSLAIPPREILGRGDHAVQMLWHPGFPIADASAFEGFFALVARTDAVDEALRPQPLVLRGVSGRAVFTPDRIRLCGLTGRLADSTARIDATINGYSADAPVSASLICSNLQIPRLPRYLPTLPQEARKQFAKFRPSGVGDLAAQVVRRNPGGPLDAWLLLDVRDGGFCFDDFAYPVRNARGPLLFHRDPVTRAARVDIGPITGRGMEGSPNQERLVTLQGWVSPLNRGVGMDLRITSSEVCLDRRLRAVMPRDVRKVLDMLDYRVGEPEHGEGAYTVPLEAQGALEARITRQAGPNRKLRVEVDLDLAHGSGSFSEFPYPLRHVRGRVMVRPDHVLLQNVEAIEGERRLTLDGRINFVKGEPVEPVLQITAQRVPVDADLLQAIPFDQRQWIQRIDLGGRLGVQGRIFLSRPSPGGKPVVDWDLDMRLEEGHVWRVLETHAATDVSARAELTRTQLLIQEAAGRQGEAQLSATGLIAWPEEGGRFELTVNARNLAADEVVYGLIPQDSRDWWDQLRPKGRGDVTVGYTLGDRIAGGEDETFRILIQPTALALRPVQIPWKIDRITGDIEIVPGTTTLRNVVLRHGDATVRLSGTGRSLLTSFWDTLAWEMESWKPAAWDQWRTLAEAIVLPGGELRLQSWDLKLSGERIQMDEELRAALPAGLGDALVEASAVGEISLDYPTFSYRTLRPASDGRAGDRTSMIRVGLQGRTSVAGGSATVVGMPLSGVNATADLTLGVLNGSVQNLAGRVDIPIAQVEGRPVRDVHGSIAWLPRYRLYQFGNLEAKLAGGKLAGQFDLEVPVYGPVRYALSAVLKDVDVGDLAGGEKKMKGQLTGSLALEGQWDNAASHRGRGDLQIQGANLYEIPVVFGLVQIANLALPIKTPFREATARYSVQGPRVTLEQVELRTPNMLVGGSGFLDFTTRKVEMTLTPDNPNLPDIPLLGEFLRGAKEELLQIRVTGTITEQQVSASSMRTFTATVDKVLNDPPNGRERRRQRGDSEK